MPCRRPVFLPALLLALAAGGPLPGCDDPGGSSALVGDVIADTTLLGDVATLDAADGEAPPDAAPDAAPSDTLPPDAAPGDADVGPADSAPADLSPADADGAVGPPDALAGGVLLAEIDSDGLNVASAAARFTDPQPAATGTVIGPCTVADTDPAQPAPAAYGYDAGVLSVSGTSPAVTLTPVDEGPLGTGYASSLPEGQEDLLPGGGALVTVTGAGGADVAAFTAVVQMPEPVQLEAPATGLFTTLPASKDLTVSWNAGTGDQVLVTLSPLGADFQPAKGPAAACVAETDGGSLVVPAAALGQVRAGGSPRFALGVTRLRTTIKDAAGLPVQVTATRSTGGLLMLGP